MGRSRPGWAAARGVKPGPEEGPAPERGRFRRRGLAGLPSLRPDAWPRLRALGLREPQSQSPQQWITHPRLRRPPPSVWLCGVVSFPSACDSGGPYPLCCDSDSGTVPEEGLLIADSFPLHLSPPGIKAHTLPPGNCPPSWCLELLCSLRMGEVMNHSLAWLILMIVDVCQQGEDQRLPPPPSSPTSDLQCQCWFIFLSEAA